MNFNVDKLVAYYLNYKILDLFDFNLKCKFAKKIR